MVNSCGYGPYAVRTVLGCVINGLNGICINDERKLSSVVVNQISVSNLEVLLNNQYKHDFNELPSQDKGVSREEKVYGHYEILCNSTGREILPFKRQDSLETDACINAIRCFISRRGQVIHIRSDNGTNFIGAERELRQAVGELNHEHIQGALHSAGVKWSFNPPAGSHHGGVWERMIRIVSCLTTQMTWKCSLPTIFF